MIQVDGISEWVVSEQEQCLVYFFRSLWANLLISENLEITAKGRRSRLIHHTTREAFQQRFDSFFSGT